jgi:single-stranded DNA-binding protein
MINAQATIIGNVTNDPELKYIASGAALLRFTVASNHYWTDGAKRSKICLIADNVAILTRSIESFERKRRSNNEGGSPASPKKAVSPRQAQQRQSVPTIQDNEEPF